MALIFDLIRSDRARVPFMTEDEVLEVFLVIDLLNNIVKTFGSNDTIACRILQRTYGQTLPKE